MFMQVDRSTRRIAGRPGHRPDAGAQPGRHARRHGRGRSDGPGHGSEFIVRLPLARSNAALPDRDARRIQPLPSRRILDRRRQPRRRREPRRCCCTCSAPRCALAHSGRAALECVDSFRPDVGAARHRHARHGRLRSRAAHPRQSENRHISLIALTAGDRTKIAGDRPRRLRPPPRQARRHRTTPPIAHCRVTSLLHTFGRLSGTPDA